MHVTCCDAPRLQIQTCLCSTLPRTIHHQTRHRKAAPHAGLRTPGRIAATLHVKPLRPDTRAHVGPVLFPAPTRRSAGALSGVNAVTCSYAQLQQTAACDTRFQQTRLCTHRSQHRLCCAVQARCPRCTQATARRTRQRRAASCRAAGHLAIRPLAPPTPPLTTAPRGRTGGCSAVPTTPPHQLHQRSPSQLGPPPVESFSVFVANGSIAAACGADRRSLLGRECIDVAASHAARCADQSARAAGVSCRRGLRGRAVVWREGRHAARAGRPLPRIAPGRRGLRGGAEPQ